MPSIEEGEEEEETRKLVGSGLPYIEAGETPLLSLVFLCPSIPHIDFDLDN